MGRGQRAKVPSVKLCDFVVKTVRKLSSSPSSSSTPHHASGMPYLIVHFVNCDRCSVGHRNFLAAVSARSEPPSFKEAKKYPGWQEDMHHEIKALEDNGTWSMESLSPGKRALGSRWVYKVKYNSDGSIERLKARIVVFSNHQVAVIDYTDTFDPVAKMTTVRAFLVVVAAKNLELHQMEVHNAFFHGDLSDEVYMKLPPGFHSAKPNQVCRLRKPLYGLKQAPRCWFAKLAHSLKSYGFQQSYFD